MNEAFKEELADMEANERTARELEECYFSDEEDLVVNPAARNRKSSQVCVGSVLLYWRGVYACIAILKWGVWCISQF